MGAATRRGWFSPGILGLHLLAVAAVVFCALMGTWQLGVYEGRQADAAADRVDDASVPLAEVWGPNDPFTNDLTGKPVSVAGEFAPADEQFWVTDRKRSDRVGVWLVAPVHTVGDSALLVVRGWAPRPTATLPAVPSKPVEVSAVLQPGENAAAPFDAATREIGSLRIPALVNELPDDLYSGFAIATESTSDLALASLPDRDVSWTVGLKNLAYALQWAVFGLFAVFMWWRMVADLREPPVGSLTG